MLTSKVSLNLAVRDLDRLGVACVAFESINIITEGKGVQGVWEYGKDGEGREGEGGRRGEKEEGRREGECTVVAARPSYGDNGPHSRLPSLRFSILSFEFFFEWRVLCQNSINRHSWTDQDIQFSHRCTLAKTGWPM